LSIKIAEDNKYEYGVLSRISLLYNSKKFITIETRKLTWDWLIYWYLKCIKNFKIISIIWIRVKSDKMFEIERIYKLFH